MAEAWISTTGNNGLFSSMLPGSREAAFFRDMVIAGTAIADPEDSRASASLWHG
ncbi:hypothetical protein [Paracoccus sp. Arc7-R13]|uniref:hypothetical protein n=1 Tax=Paracoccus sp. Arc7-R13 TaxID=2500532 RepID=UPI0013E3EAA4|nr:hypothetical protein [Paracoccus sp. Arc7-R13]